LVEEIELASGVEIVVVSKEENEVVDAFTGTQGHSNPVLLQKRQF